MAIAGLRIGVIGATGALGAELLEVLGGSAIRVAQIVPVATEKSLGAEVEFQGEVVAVETELPSLHGLDFVFLCANAPIRPLPVCGPSWPPVGPKMAQEGPRRPQDGAT